MSSLAYMKAFGDESYILEAKDDFTIKIDIELYKTKTLLIFALKEILTKELEHLTNLNNHLNEL
jgi:hypothetical protein